MEDARLRLPARINRAARLVEAALLVFLVTVGCDGDGIPEGFARGVGRLEAEEIHVATPVAGRVSSVTVDEGDRVEAGQVLVRMDTDTLEAEADRARAAVRRAREETRAAAAVLVQRRSECSLAEKELARVRRLVASDVASEAQLDEKATRVETAEAACDRARAEIDDAEAAVAEAEAVLVRVQEEIEDAVLTAPRAGRVQYRLVEPGEVLGIGGRAVTLLDLSDVTMAIFLPTAEAGRVRIGEEARVVLDAHPNHPLPARVSFVADEAQFTPKQVETESERQKLAFRVKVEIRDEVAIPLNPGTPGVVWVRLHPAAPWPAELRLETTASR